MCSSVSQNVTKRKRYRVHGMIYIIHIYSIYQLNPEKQKFDNYQQKETREKFIKVL